MRHADADLRRLLQVVESIGKDIEQCLAIDAVIRKHGFAERVGVVVHHPSRFIRVEHIGRRHARRYSRDDARLQFQFQLDDVSETGLPPAAVSAAGEYDLIEHYFVKSA